MRKKRKGVVCAILAIVLVAGGFNWWPGERRLLWTLTVGSGKVRAAMSPEGQLVLSTANRVEILHSDGEVELILSRPSEILEFVDQFETGFLIVEWFGGQEWLRKYNWGGDVLWGRPTTNSLRQISSSRDGHFAGVLNRTELALFDPDGLLVWKKSKKGSRHECLGFAGPDTIAYRTIGSTDPFDMISDSVRLVDVAGNHINTAKVNDSHRIPLVSAVGAIATLDSRNVTLFDGRAEQLWTRNQYETMSSTNQNKWVGSETFVCVSAKTNVFVLQPNGGIWMFDSQGDFKWTYPDIEQIPLVGEQTPSKGEDVLLFSYPVSNAPRSPYSISLPRHTSIMDLNSDGSLNWKEEIQGWPDRNPPLSFHSLRMKLKNGFRSSFIPISPPLRDRDGVVYAVGFSGRNVVVHAFRADAHSEQMFGKSGKAAVVEER